jgi:hypothetical protein
MELEQEKLVLMLFHEALRHDINLHFVIIRHSFYAAPFTFPLPTSACEELLDFNVVSVSTWNRTHFEQKV